MVIKAGQAGLPRLKALRLAPALPIAGLAARLEELHLEMAGEASWTLSCPELSPSWGRGAFVTEEGGGTCGRGRVRRRGFTCVGGKGLG
jgi:hypothetical protein